VKERFAPKDEKSLLLRFHTQTAGSSLTAQQPRNNIIRTTLQALAAVLGGTQSLHTNGFDEALGLPTEESARLALRTQQIIAEESGVALAADPLGGSYLVESLTNELEQEARKRIEKIDAMGGMLSAIEQRYPQGEIENSAFEAQRAIETGAAAVVGVNTFADDTEVAPPILEIDPRVEQDQQQRITLDQVIYVSDLGQEAAAQIPTPAQVQALNTFGRFNPSQLEAALRAQPQARVLSCHRP
jgi:methylmalonyl-CoA mutase N-terminal domain/subunit